jgi:hexosaminidase
MKFLDEIPLLLNSLGQQLFSGSQSYTAFSDPLPAPNAISWSFNEPPIVLGQLKLVTLFDKEAEAKSPFASAHSILSGAFNRSVSSIRTQSWSPPTSEFENFTLTDIDLQVSPVTEIQVTVQDISADLQQGVDESFTLQIPAPEDSTKIAINSQTIWGTLHALTTLEQLTLSKDGHVFIEHPVSISDGPLYPYRGLMIDTSRNFYSVADLERQIDTLHLAKMNVFHWHITDNQAWPIEVSSYPQMTRDAYSPDEIYSIADVKHLVQYGYERGVRIIPEIDMPGHSSAGWQQIDGDIVACKDSNWEVTAAEPVPGQLEILSNQTYKLLENVYNDVSQLFHDNYFHVGFDELNVECYKESAITRQWFEENPTYNTSDLAQYWVDHAVPIFMNNEQRKLIMWQDAVLSAHIPAKSIPKSVTLQVWTGDRDNVGTLIDMGYDVIFSSADFLYLDCGFGQWTANDSLVGDQANPNPGSPTYNYGGNGGSWCGPYKSWQRIYSIDLGFELTEAQQKHVIGGSAHLWSEQSGGLTVDFMVWPRLASLAELLWSGNLGSDGKLRNEEFTRRIYYFRERLVQRGISAAVLGPKYCLKHPDACSSVS